MAKFEETDTVVLGISIDSPFANQRFAKEIGVTFPLLSDLNRAVSKKYGILDEERGVARRTTFVIDKEGIIRHIEQGATAIDPSGARNACSLLAGKKSSPQDK